MDEWKDGWEGRDGLFKYLNEWVGRWIGWWVDGRVARCVGRYLDEWDDR